MSMEHVELQSDASRCKETRKEILGSHFRGKAEKHFPVMITSYEIVIRDVKELKKIQWKFAIIDEGHRLKNMNCRLIRELKSICGSGWRQHLILGLGQICVMKSK